MTDQEVLENLRRLAALVGNPTYAHIALVQIITRRLYAEFSERLKSAPATLLGKEKANA